MKDNQQREPRGKAGGTGEEKDAAPDRPASTLDRWSIFPREVVSEVAYREHCASGFPYRRLSVARCMLVINKLAATPTEKLLQTQTAYQVADTYHPHRFHATSNGKRSPFEAFRDNELLRCAIAFKFSGQRPMTEILDVLGHIHGTQACYNFRPGFALYVYRQYAWPGATVLDTCAGYGGRLVGFIASGFAGRYIGIDPCTASHMGNTRLATDLGYTKHVTLHHLPVEELSPGFMAGECDLAFTSPPYFTKEHYSDEPTQSWVRYPEPEAWQQGFLRPMLRVQYEALKPGSYAVVIVADVRIRGVQYPLVDWTKAAACCAGFHFAGQQDYMLNARLGGKRGAGIAMETALLFHKPPQSL
jgi:hypothetical protein